MIDRACQLGDTAEVELRFGKLCNGRFMTDVGEASFEKVLGRLRTNPKWTATETLHLTDERLRGGVRRRSGIHGVVHCCKKDKIAVHDVKTDSSPLDYRMCLSSEKPVADSPKAQPTHTVKKMRYRFVHKDLWAFELTKNTYDRPPDVDSESLVEHQIEIELVSRPAKGSRYAAEYGLLLAQDVLKMLA